MPKSLEGLENFFVSELYQLFSSFLRGASRPKSPRYAVPAAASFMLELALVVKAKVAPASCQQHIPALLRQRNRCKQTFTRTRPDGQLSLETHRTEGGTPAPLECYTLRW